MSSNGFAFPPPPPPPPVNAHPNQPTSGPRSAPQSGFRGRTGGRGRGSRGYTPRGNANATARGGCSQGRGSYSNFNAHHDMPSRAFCDPLEYHHARGGQDMGNGQFHHSFLPPGYGQASGGPWNGMGERPLMPTQNQSSNSVNYFDPSSQASINQQRPYGLLSYNPNPYPNTSIRPTHHSSSAPPTAYDGFPAFFPSYRGGREKRKHGNAFGKNNAPGSRSQVAPAVPAFGARLPVSANSPARPPMQSSTKAPKKKQRKHNILGLTPKAEVHESSEEEDDADEESNLAAAVCTNGGSYVQQLQVTHNGKTFRLHSASDIAAWIEERRKNYPTRARVEEAALKQRPSKKAKKEMQKVIKKGRFQGDTDEQLKRKTKGKTKSLQEGTPELKLTADKPAQPSTMEFAANEVTKARAKLERLRKQLVKEERKVAAVEAHITNSPRPANSDLHLSGGAIRLEDDSKDLLQGKGELTISAAQDTTPNTSQKHVKALGPEQPRIERDVKGSIDSLCDSTSGISSTDSDDFTSSSGTSSSTNDSDEEAPEQLHLKRNQTHKNPAPKRQKVKAICRQFAQSGSCRFGPRCRHAHQKPDKGNGISKTDTDIEKQRGGRKGRISLYQRLVKQEKEQEVQEALTAKPCEDKAAALETPEARGNEEAGAGR